MRYTHKRMPMTTIVACISILLSGCGRSDSVSKKVDATLERYKAVVGVPQWESDRRAQVLSGLKRFREHPLQGPAVLYAFQFSRGNASQVGLIVDYVDASYRTAFIRVHWDGGKCVDLIERAVDKEVHSQLAQEAVLFTAVFPFDVVNLPPFWGSNSICVEVHTSDGPVSEPYSVNRIQLPATLPTP